MSERDISRNMRVSQSIKVALHTDGTVNGAGIDVRDYRGVMVVFESEAAIADGSHLPSIEESDDDITFAAVDSGEVVGALTAFTSSAEGIQKQGYIGIKRYIRAKLVTTGASTGGRISGMVVSGIPHRAPVS